PPLLGQVPAKLTSLNVITTPPPPSVPVATPVKFVPVFPQVVLVSPGQVMTGAMTSSFHVITCVQLLLLLHPSSAVYFNVRVRTQPLVASTLLQLTVAVPQVSVAVTA